MIAFPSGASVLIARGITDMRCCMNSLALKVQQGLGASHMVASSSASVELGGRAEQPAGRRLMAG